MSGENGTPEDDLSAWGDALKSAVGDATLDGAGPPEMARVLNQAEIDSLLGRDDGAEGSGSQSAMHRIISSGLVSYERLPMLEIVFDRLVRLMSTTLRNFTSDNVEVSIETMSSLRFGDYLNAVPPQAMLAVFKAEAWDNYGLVVVDSSLIYSTVDVLLGGRRGTSPMRVDGRPYTTIERTLVERLIRVVLSDLSVAFAPICDVEFRFNRLEVNPRFAAISRDSNASILVRMAIEMEDRGGRFDMVLPYATLEPVREKLLQQFVGERFGRDSIWESHLAEQLRHTDISLDVVLDEQVMSLNHVLSLRPGDRIALGVPPGAPVRLRCGDVALFEAELGRRGNRLAVRIGAEADRSGTLEAEDA